MWGMRAFKSLAGWREIRLPRQEDALEADGPFGWPCSSILLFQRPLVPTDSRERARSPPTSSLFVPARNVDETVHSFPPATCSHPFPHSRRHTPSTLPPSVTPLPVVPPLPLSIRPRTSRRAQPALPCACACSHALFPNPVRGGKLFALQAFILHFLPASIPAFASLRLFPWIWGRW